MKTAERATLGGMWTATLLDVERDDTNLTLRYTVEYDNGLTGNASVKHQYTVSGHLRLLGDGRVSVLQTGDRRFEAPDDGSALYQILQGLARLAQLSEGSRLPTGQVLGRRELQHYLDVARGVQPAGVPPSDATQARQQPHHAPEHHAEAAHAVQDAKKPHDAPAPPAAKKAHQEPPAPSKPVPHAKR